MKTPDSNENIGDRDNPASETVYVVDAFDNVCKASTRGEMRQSGLLHRVTYLLVFNESGQLLVQTRTASKDWYPGFLDFAAGGVVQYGESYGESAQRELDEELGIAVALKSHFKIYFEDRSTDPVTRSWGRVYSCTSNGPFTLQAEEVDGVTFMDIDEALAIDPSKVTPDTRLALLSYLL